MMKKILRACFLLVLMVTSGGLLKAQQPFITRWNLATEGTGTTQLSFGTATSGPVNYTWKEVSPGSASGSGTFSGNNLTITGLPANAIIRLSIAPANFRRIIIGNTIEGRRLLDVEQWGSTAWTSMRDAFFGCHNLNITATDIPNLSATNMDMGQMFQSCFSLKTVPNINSWNTSSVIYMTSMFNNARLFNQNIGSWNTANVIGMVRMFTNANSFNQDISGWNTAKVGSMISMFELATSFNQNIGNWNTGAVTDMTKMFQHATSFNQNLGKWRLNANVDLSNMLNNSGLDCGNYAATLVGWNANPNTPNGRTLGASGRNYGQQATAARANLVGTKGWTITGDVLNSNCGGAFITRWDVTGTSSLSFGTATGGNVTYIWQEVSPGSASGSGTFSGSALTITGLPSGATTIDVSIFPTNFQRINISNNQPTSHRLLDVKQWGTTAWTSMQNAFFGCSNLNISATDIPNLTSVTRAEQMFQSCAKLTGPANINSWNVAALTNMTSMFNGCSLFNQNIGSWNTANVTTMQNMFAKAGSFNQNISGWNTAKLTRTSGMFEGASSFNQNIGGWNTAAVTMMDKMFQHATSFNQNLGNWKLNANVDMSNMLDNSGLDCANYAATLVGWNANPSTPNGRTLGAAGRNYGQQAKAARDNLTGPKGWTITGDVQSNICDAFITRWDLAGTTTLSFGTATSGTVNYTWKEVSPGKASGSGSFSGNTLTINGLPSTTIDLFIAPANFQRINISNNQPTSHRLLDVKQWGTTAWTSMQNAFFGCSNLNISATDIPNLTSVTRAEQMFQSCAKLTGPANINSWNVAALTNMTSMFNGCSLFNQNIGSWNTANVTTMQNMFAKAGSFNQNISGWNTAKLTRTSGMFEGASSFNQNIGGWNTAAVTMMDKMFQHATSFNQNLGNWKLNANVDMSNMLDNSGLDCANYAATLVGWNANPSTPNGRSLGATGRTYGPQATAARNNLTGPKGWIITGDASSIICGISSAPSERLRTDLVGEGSKVDENVYPNPFVGRVTIEADLKDVTEKDIQVIDLLGREFRPLSTRKISVTRMELDLSNLVTGQYFIKINSKLGTKVFKVMRQ